LIVRFSLSSLAADIFFIGCLLVILVHNIEKLWRYGDMKSTTHLVHLLAQGISESSCLCIYGFLDIVVLLVCGLALIGVGYFSCASGCLDNDKCFLEALS